MTPPYIITTKTSTFCTYLSLIIQENDVEVKDSKTVFGRWKDRVEHWWGQGQRFRHLLHPSVSPAGGPCYTYRRCNILWGCELRLGPPWHTWKPHAAVSITFWNWQTPHWGSPLQQHLSPASSQPNQHVSYPFVHVHVFCINPVDAAQTLGCQCGTLWQTNFPSDCYMKTLAFEESRHMMTMFMYPSMFLTTVDERFVHHSRNRLKVTLQHHLHPSCRPHLIQCHALPHKRSFFITNNNFSICSTHFGRLFYSSEKLHSYIYVLFAW